MLIAHDSTVSRGIGELYREKRHGIATRQCQQLSQRLCIDQRHITIENERDGIVVERWHCLLHRMPGAELFGL